MSKVNGKIAKLPTVEEFTGDNPNIFIPTWENKPEAVKPVISLHGTSILTYQNSTSIIAHPGAGKTSLGEAVIANYINQNADSLGLVVPSDLPGIISTDMEQTREDVWNSFYRICRRARVQKGTALNNVLIAGMRAIPRLDERKKEIENLLNNHPCGLLIIDGAGDMVTDTNDLEQAVECRIWFREITSRYNLSILTTLHPNPNSNKPRGHIGSEIWRESECVLLAKKVGQGRILTTDFEYGKNRNNGHVSAGYTWSDEHKMFISADVDGFEEKSNGAKTAKLEALVLKLLPPPKALTRTDLEKEVVKIGEAQSISTANRRIRDLLASELIKKHEDGFYRAII